MKTGGTIVDETVSYDSEPSSQPGTPKTKVKFSCSYGGKIVLRPPNGHLKYVGGETRVISVPIDIAFQDLMTKLTYLMDGEMILKYQIVPEELETLVSVKTDEDLQLMFNECSRCESSGAPRLRAFLFPEKPSPVANGSTEPQSPLEQCYINAINGIGLPPTRQATKPNTVVNTSWAPTMSPPERCNADFLNYEASLVNDDLNGVKGMQRVQSSPSVCNLGKRQSPETSNFHNLYHKHRQQSNYKYPIPKLVIDPHRGGPLEKSRSARYVGLTERERYQLESSPQYLQFPSMHNHCHGGCTRFLQYDQSTPYMRQERAGSLPVSPQLSPLGSPRRKGWVTPPTGAY